jgi:hypothetical protein
MNLLKLPAEVREFPAGLEDAREIRKYFETKLRNDFLKWLIFHIRKAFLYPSLYFVSCSPETSQL